MSGFVFRLERLLRLRAQEETERARNLGQALRAAEAARSAFEDAAAYLEKCREQLQEDDGRMLAGTLRNLALAVDVAQTRAEDAEEDCRATDHAVEEAQEEFGEARKERRVIERLRDRRRDSWTVEENREEQKETDGVAVQRWNHRGES